jgi:hypothetical protein
MATDHLVSEFLSLVQIENFEETYSKEILEGKFFGLPLEPIINSEKKLLSKDAQGIAYFSMEYGLATSFYNKFKSNRPIAQANKAPESEVFSNYSLADYFFALAPDNIIDILYIAGDWEF